MSSLFNVFNISGSAMAAQSQRLNTVASNLANADSATSATGEPYKAKQVLFKSISLGSKDVSGVKVDKVIEASTPGRKVYDPQNPLADEDGFVSMPHVNITQEMVNMISTSRT